MDTELLDDETYYVIEIDGTVAVCGGWSKRKTFFGGNQCSSRETGYLNPKTDAAKIRAFFVHPDYARHGLGKILLAHCEKQAVAQGFLKLEMMATLTGAKLYKTQGYENHSINEHVLPNCTLLKFIQMKKDMPRDVKIMTSSFCFFSSESKNLKKDDHKLTFDSEKNSDIVLSRETKPNLIYEPF